MPQDCRMTARSATPRRRAGESRVHPVPSCHPVCRWLVAGRFKGSESLKWRAFVFNDPDPLENGFVGWQLGTTTHPDPVPKKDGTLQTETRACDAPGAVRVIRVIRVRPWPVLLPFSGPPSSWAMRSDARAPRFARVGGTLQRPVVVERMCRRLVASRNRHP